MIVAWGRVGQHSGVADGLLFWAMFEYVKKFWSHVRENIKTLLSPEALAILFVCMLPFLIAVAFIILRRVFFP